MRHRSRLLHLSCCLLLGSQGLPAQQPPPAARQPVAFPKLEHFEGLWKRSIFTTKDLPSPDTPSGPNFADNLSLSGIYEIDGAIVAVLVDRATSQVMEARMGAENEAGIKIREVKPGESVEKTRVRLQKGEQAGWVGFADMAAEPPAEVVQRAVIPGEARSPVPAPARRMQPPVPLPEHARRPQAPNPILPPPSAAGMPQARPAPVKDVPLPPP